MIVQQPAVFTANSQDMHQGFSGMVAAGAAVLQSRWTLAREIPRLRAQADAVKRGGQVPLAHCVGHGLFVRANHFAQVGGLPVQTMNEDLAFGYLACAAGTAIHPLPSIEIGDAPQSAAGVVAQGRQWFWSYAQYPAMARLAAARKLSTPRQRARLTTTGLVRGALWLGQSPAIAGALALPVLHYRAGGSARYGLLATGLSWAAVGAYCAPAARLALELPDRDASRRALAGIVPAALISSLGPWLCLADVLRAALTGEMPAHAKTES